MAQNNLRIIYKNSANNATITSTSTPLGVTSLANLKLDAKSLVCRTAGTSVTYNLALPSDEIIGGVVLPFCNLTSTATISVVLKTGGSLGTTVLSTSSILACPYQNLGMWDWGAVPLGVNNYSYGGGTYGRIWFAQTSCNYISITITDTENTSGYIECSRIVAGAYWTPKYNTSFGLSSSMKDLSEHTRMESGDLVTNRGITFTSLSFDLNWLAPSDRLQFSNILKRGGTSSPLLISLFPDCTEDWGKEQVYQIYGKLSQLNPLTHPIFEMYSTQVEIEEI